MRILKGAIVGLAVLGGAALSAGTASAMPVAPLGAAAAPAAENVRLVCDAWGRCWRRPNYYYRGPVVVGPRYGYYGPRYYGPRWHYRHWHRW